MTSPTIVNRYANALADVVIAPHSEVAPAAALAQLRSFYSSASAVPELQAVMASPAVSKEHERQLMRRVAITGMLPIPLIIFALIVRLIVGG